MDLNKLTPAPWFWSKCGNWIFGPDVNGIVGEHILCYNTDDDGLHGEQADKDFIALARNAFDVMMRRGWSPCLAEEDGPLDEWTLFDSGGLPVISCPGVTVPRIWPDPFTALVEADEWYKENVECHHSK